MDAKTEQRQLKCILTDEEKAAYREEMGAKEGALRSVTRRAKRMLLKINGLKLDREALAEARLYGLRETDQVDDNGGYVLQIVDDLKALDYENLEVTTEQTQLGEERSGVLERLKVLKRRIGALAQALLYGEEERSVLCEWIPQVELSVAWLYRTDTKEVIETRPLDSEEKEDLAQGVLSFDTHASNSAKVECICHVFFKPAKKTGLIKEHGNCPGSGLTVEQLRTFHARLTGLETTASDLTLNRIRDEIVNGTGGHETGEETNPELSYDGYVPAPDGVVIGDVIAAEFDDRDDTEADVEDEFADDPFSESTDDAQVLEAITLALKGRELSDLYPADVGVFLDDCGTLATDVRAYIVAQRASELKPRTLQAFDVATP